MFWDRSKGCLTVTELDCLKQGFGAAFGLLDDSGKPIREGGDVFPLYKYMNEFSIAPVAKLLGATYPNDPDLFMVGFQWISDCVKGLRLVAFNEGAITPSNRLLADGGDCVELDASFGERVRSYHLLLEKKFTILSELVWLGFSDPKIADVDKVFSEFVGCDESQVGFGAGYRDDPLSYWDVSETKCFLLCGADLAKVKEQYVMAIYRSLAKAISHFHFRGEANWLCSLVEDIRNVWGYAAQLGSVLDMGEVEGGSSFLVLTKDAKDRIHYTGGSMGVQHTLSGVSRILYLAGI